MEGVREELVVELEIPLFRHRVWHILPHITHFATTCLSQHESLQKIHFLPTTIKDYENDISEGRLSKDRDARKILLV